MSEEWRKKYEKKYWKPEKELDYIEGVFTKVKQKEIAGQQSDVPVIENEEGIEKELPAHTQLLYQLSEIPFGTHIKIVYTGKRINKFKKEVNQYTVEKIS